MNEACQIVGKGRREDTVSYGEAASHNAVCQKFSRGIIHLGDAVWREPFSKAVSSEDERMKGIRNDMIM